jgi:tau tubulin kinase
MEYLPGQDMHQLREAVMTHPEHYANSSTGKDHHHHPHSSTRRIELADAVYLTAEVMLPLLRRLHSVGVVHRDVKPSNCVLRREKSKSEGGGGEFRMVDFGLSKSIVVPEDSPHADKEHYWPESRPWQKPSNYTRRGCYRVAREKAEFRGTSMYASLRVHQLRDYCPRDDMWSLMYVFCDLVSGGLPWMQQAANRDRTECQRIKEMVHGDGEKYETDQTELLLMGDCYHVAKFRKDRYEAAAQAAESSGRQPPAPPSKSIDLPPPLALSQDPRLVSRLRDVFTHLAKLEFWETPDYDMIQRNIRGFLDTTVRTPLLPRISYDMPVADRGMHKSSLLDSRRNMPRGSLPEETDPLAGDIFENVDDSSESAKNSDDCLRLLPLELRYRLAQMEYHASRPDAVPMTLALRDWLKATLPLLYGEWDTPKYEGRHRTSTDGLKRELYLELLERCLRWASAFDNFTSKSCYTKDTTKKRLLESSRRSNSGDDPAASTRISKQRRIDPLAAAFITVSRALFGLRLAIQVEQAKKSGAQATRLNFS